MRVERAFRVRRSCLAVPASNERFIEKAQGLPADEVFLDLEDSVAPAAKEQARANAADAVGGDWSGRLVAVRVNDAGTQWAHRDVLAVASGDARADVIILPKVTSPDHIVWLDLLLAQVEREAGLTVGQIGIEAQIEDAGGLIACEAIAAASPRMETLIFGPGDYSADVGIPITTIGGAPEGYPGDHLNYVYSRLVVAARAAGLQVIDGPYGRIEDIDGLIERARIARALGMDGKWTIHPSQIAPLNELFTPARSDFERASAMLAAFERATSGATLFEGEMIDEANRKMAERIVRAGRAAGLEQLPKE